GGRRSVVRSARGRRAARRHGVNDAAQPTLPAALAASDAVFAWCLRGALRAEREGDRERAALWAYVAAGTGIFYGHSRLCSPELESLVGRLGQALPEVQPALQP